MNIFRRPKPSLDNVIPIPMTAVQLEKIRRSQAISKIVSGLMELGPGSFPKELPPILQSVGAKPGNLRSLGHLLAQKADEMERDAR